MTDLHLRQLEAKFLSSTGWRRSTLLQQAVDAHGPVPWFTYPAIRFLAARVRPGWRVLEYGSGNSTRWWAARVREVVAVEHDPAWAARLQQDLPANVTLFERVMDDPLSDAAELLLRTEWFPSGCWGVQSPDPLRNYRAGLLDAGYRAYAAVGLDYPAGHFDVIVVDGMARALTAWIAARQVSPRGLVVFDNADRPEYAAGYDVLLRAGFVRLDFWGLGPINPYEWCTAVFVRDIETLRHPAPLCPGTST